VIKSFGNCNTVVNPPLPHPRPLPNANALERGEKHKCILWELPSMAHVFYALGRGRGRVKD